MGLCFFFIVGKYLISICSLDFIEHWCISLKFIIILVPPFSEFDMDVDEVRKEVAEHEDFYRCQLKELQAKIQLERQLERERSVEVPAFPQVSADQEQAASLKVEKFLQSHPNLKTNSLPGKRVGSKELTSSALLGLSRLASFPDMKQFSSRISELGLEAPLYRESILKPNNPKRGNTVPERQCGAKPAGRGGAISSTKSLVQCSATRDVASVQALKPSTKQKASAKVGVSKQKDWAAILCWSTVIRLVILWVNMTGFYFFFGTAAYSFCFFLLHYAYICDFDL